MFCFPLVRRMMRFVVVMGGLAVFTGSFCVCMGAGTAPEAAVSPEDLRKFVADRAADPGTFILNPPKELHFYEDVSKEELSQRQQEMMRNGAVLTLYQDGMPRQLLTRKAVRLDGPVKTWYPDGQLQSDEVWMSGELTQGRYWNAAGELLGEVKNGSGRRVEFSAGGGSSAKVESEAEYADGLKEGREVRYWDAERKSVARETFYHLGKREGLAQQWAVDGQILSSTPYVRDRPDGLETSWHPNGKVRQYRHFRSGMETGNTSRYFRSGQISEAIFREEGEDELEIRWFPEGSMAECVWRDPRTDRVVRGWTFDRDGRSTGEVMEGAGQLLRVDFSSDEREAEDFRLALYTPGKRAAEQRLPKLRVTSARGVEKSVVFRCAAETGTGFDFLTTEILPPAGADSSSADAASRTVQCKPGESSDAEITIPLPAGYKEWFGRIYGRTKVTGQAGDVEFTQLILTATPEKPITD